MNIFRVWMLLVAGMFSAALCANAEEANSAHYYSYVNWDYGHRNDLIGWKNTSVLVRESLRDWHYHLNENSLENSTPDELTQFQEQFRSSASVGVNIIYVASHQTPSGRLDFPGKEKVFWAEGFGGAAKLGGQPSILLLDVCHADVIPQSQMNGPFPFNFILSAAAPDEETYELRMFSRRPVDFKRRFPAEVEWMQSKLGPDWKGQVSFTGFIWVRQFLQTPQAPRNQAEWQQFLAGMEVEARVFARERSRYISSTIKLWRE